MSEAKEIAGKLTKRERLDVRRYKRGSIPCKSSMRSFIEKGLIGFSDENGIRCDNFTPLGLAVARELGEKND